MKTNLLFFIILFALTSLKAQWPASPDSGLVLEYGWYPRITSDNNGGAYVAFEPDFFNIKIYKIDKWGEIEWINSNIGGIEDFQHLRAIEEDGFGGLFVVFADVIDVSLYELYDILTIQKIDENGNNLWGDGIRVASLDTTIQLDPVIVPDSNGGCIVSFLDNRFGYYPTGPEFDLFVQRIDSLGNICWGDSAVQLTNSTRIQYNNFLVVNEKLESTLIWYDRPIYKIQRLDSAGQFLLGDSGLAIGAIPVKFYLPDEYKGFYTSGISYENGMFSLTCDHVDSLGQRLWGVNGITLVDSVDFYNHKSDVTGMIYNNSGNIIISYYFTKNGITDFYLQKITPNGTKLFGNIGIPVSNHVSTKWGVGMVPSENSVLCLWYDDRNVSGTYVQKLHYDGNQIWGNDILFSNYSIYKYTHDSNGGLIGLYWDSTMVIYVTKISKNGNIGEVITSIDNTKNGKPINDFILYQNFPNPFNPTTQIKFDLLKSSDVKIVIYNNLGQEIKTLLNERKDSGRFEVIWDGRNNIGKSVATGVYFYRIETDDFIKNRKMILFR